MTDFFWQNIIIGYIYIVALQIGNQLISFFLSEFLKIANHFQSALFELPLVIHIPYMTFLVSSS